MFAVGEKAALAGGAGADEVMTSGAALQVIYLTSSHRE
jgi:hypothetical protein